MLVNTEIKDRIAYVEMQNPGHLNCLSEEMCLGLIEALENAYAQECVGVVIKAQTKRGVWKRRPRYPRAAPGRHRSPVL